MTDLAFTRWGVLWRSENILEGRERYIMWESECPMLFRTRVQARKWIHENYGYIAKRPDLKREPHGWRMPVPVRVEVRLADKGREERAMKIFEHEAWAEGFRFSRYGGGLPRNPYHPLHNPTLHDAWMDGWRRGHVGNAADALADVGREEG